MRIRAELNAGSNRREPGPATLGSRAEAPVHARPTDAPRAGELIHQASRLRADARQPHFPALEPERAKRSLRRLKLRCEQLHILENSRNFSARQRRVRRHALDVRLFARRSVSPSTTAGAAALPLSHIDHAVADDVAAAAYLNA